jgi:WD40 repeat protein
MNDPTALKAKFTLKPLKKPLDLPQQFVSACFSPTGVFLLAGSMEGTVGRWNVLLEKPEPELAEKPALTGLTSWVSTCVCLPDGKLAVGADSFGNLACWSYCDDGIEPVWKVANAHDGWIREVIVSPDGQKLATCGRDGRVVFWSTDGKRQSEIKVGGDLSVMRFAPDGKALFVGSLEGKLSQWDVASAAKVRDFDAGVLFKPDRLQEVGGIRSMAVSPDGAMLLVGGTQPVNGGNVQGKPTVLAFDVATSELKKKKEFGETGDVYVTDFEWHPDGCWLISTSGNPGQGKFLCWRVEDEQPLFETKLSNCHAVRPHPSGKWLALLTTNANSNGNGKVVDKDGQYRGNSSPLVVMTFPDANK